MGVLGALLIGGCWADFPDSFIDDDVYIPPDTIQQDLFVFKDRYLPPADTAVDARPDVQLDAQPDTVTDAAPDTATDASKDAKGDALVDALTDAVADQKLSDTLSCTPNTFIKCVTKTKLQRCNNNGDGTLTISCAPFDCNATAGRCNTCILGIVTHLLG